jgi:hypothetical protein
LALNKPTSLKKTERAVSSKHSNISDKKFPSVFEIVKQISPQLSSVELIFQLKNSNIMNAFDTFTTHLKNGKKQNNDKKLNSKDQNNDVSSESKFNHKTVKMEEDNEKIMNEVDEKDSGNDNDSKETNSNKEKSDENFEINAEIENKNQEV